MLCVTWTRLCPPFVQPKMALLQLYSCRSSLDCPQNRYQLKIARLTPTVHSIAIYTFAAYIHDYMYTYLRAMLCAMPQWIILAGS